MSLKRKLENGISVVGSLVGLMWRKLLGNRLHFSPIALVSVGASLKTYDKGSIKIGKKAAVRRNTEVSVTKGKIVIGNSCFINKNCMIVAHERIVIGKNTTIGPNVCIYDHDHDGEGGYQCAPVEIGDNTWIGASCIILKGVTIGNNVVIGAGSLVSHDVADNVVLYQRREEVIRNRVRKEAELVK